MHRLRFFFLHSRLTYPPWVRYLPETAVANPCRIPTGTTASDAGFSQTEIYLLSPKLNPTVRLICILDSVEMQRHTRIKHRIQYGKDRHSNGMESFFKTTTDRCNIRHTSTRVQIQVADGQAERKSRDTGSL